jgi:hypothetical protein
MGRTLALDQGGRDTGKEVVMYATILAGLTLAVIAAAAPPMPARAGCDDARASVARECGCDADRHGAKWRSHGRYVGCVKQASSAAVRAGSDPACKTVVDHCAARSVCGRPGAVTCIVGGKCALEADENRCRQRKGAIGSATSCCDVQL